MPGDDEAFIVAGQENVTERPYLLPGRWSRRAARRTSPSRRRRCGSGGAPVGLNAGARSSPMFQKAEERVLWKPHLPSQVCALLLAGPRRARGSGARSPGRRQMIGCRHLALRLILRTGLPHVQAVAGRHRRVRPCRERGFGGNRAWSSVSTKPTPLLDHAHDGGFLTAAQCAAMLPRLEAVIDQLRPEDSAPRSPATCRWHPPTGPCHAVLPGQGSNSAQFPMSSQAEDGLCTNHGAAVPVARRKRVGDHRTFPEVMGSGGDGPAPTHRHEVCSRPHPGLV